MPPPLPDLTPDLMTMRVFFMALLLSGKRSASTSDHSAAVAGLDAGLEDHAFCFHLSLLSQMSIGYGKRPRQGVRDEPLNSWDERGEARYEGLVPDGQVPLLSAAAADETIAGFDAALDDDLVHGESLLSPCNMAPCEGRGNGVVMNRWGPGTNRRKGDYSSNVDTFPTRTRRPSRFW